MTLFDGAIVAFYFLFLIIVTAIFKRFTKGSDDFIHGGSAMMWWMAGATAFMTQFSTWTFTGAAAKAFEDGLVILFVFWGNAIGFFVASLYFASRYRRLRVSTPMEVIKLRYGVLSEQIFTYLQIPLTILSAAIWINGLALFMAATFHVPTNITILMVGVLVTFIALSGGAWTVSATNVIQLILLVVITGVIGVFALIKVGGIYEIAGNFPVPFIWGDQINFWQIFILWVVCITIKQIFSVNNSMSCYRFLVTINDKEAKKAAIFTAILFIIGPVLWFIPPWTAAIQHIDLADLYPHLGDGVNTAAYLAFVQTNMPAGVLGLTIIVMLSSTISPMTTALNRISGICVRSLYSYIIKDSSDRAILFFGKVTTLFAGIFATASALFFNQIKEYSFFDIMMLFGALVQLPIIIPSFLGIIILKTPKWSGWTTLLIGFMVSIFAQFIFDVRWLYDGALSKRESVDLHIAWTILLQVIITGGYFCLTRLFYKQGKEARLWGVFIRNLRRPISPNEEAIINKNQSLFLGKTSMMLALGFMIFSIIAYGFSLPLALIYLWIALLIACCGGFFIWQARHHEH